MPTSLARKGWQSDDSLSAPKSMTKLLLFKSAFICIPYTFPLFTFLSSTVQQKHVSSGFLNVFWWFIFGF